MKPMLVAAALVLAADAAHAALPLHHFDGAWTCVTPAQSGTKVLLTIKGYRGHLSVQESAEKQTETKVAKVTYGGKYMKVSSDAGTVRLVERRRGPLAGIAFLPSGKLRVRCRRDA